MFEVLQTLHARRTRLREGSVQRRSAREAGFTLVELLVVITILGILAAIVVFSVSGIGDKGQTAACKTDKTTIQTAEEAYFSKFNGYTSDLTVLQNSGFLSNTSVWYSVTLVPAAGTNPATYTVVPVPGAACASVA